MKLSQRAGNGLMAISKIDSDKGRLIVTGTIMGSVPVRGVLTAAEARRGLSLMSFGTIVATIRIFISG